MQLVCEYYEISEDEITSNKKNQNIAYPRQIAMFLTRKLMDMSYKAIAELYGKSDHTTVKHAYDKIEKELKKNLEVRTLVDDFIAKLRE
jgi:chromosomal replication initiator protein